MTDFRSDSIKILAFDIFGTVVDWHTSIAREVDALQLGVDGATFASEWRNGYQPAMEQVRSGQLGWTSIDALHRRILDDLLRRYAINGVNEAEKRALNTVWHRLDAWPDVVLGLQRLKAKYIICSLSNGNLGLLANLSKRCENYI